jgi:hypothetical protein
MFASHERRRSSPTGVVDLPSAGVPSDHGLASLGLLMQLAGRTSSALAALVASLTVLDARVQRHAGWLLFVLALSIVRSQLHRIAGRDLVYGRRTLDGDVASPFDATRTYAAFGIGHAVVIGLVATSQLGATPRTGAGIAAALALWPAALALLPRLSRFRPLHAGIPLSEDRGLEGAAILMSILGTCGILSSGAMLVVVGTLQSRHLQHGWGFMFLFVFALLLVRSWTHVRAGLAGLRELSFDRPGELAARYARMGVVGAVFIGGVLALLTMAERVAPEALLSVVVVCWLLTAWPLIVKRYFNHRQFAELLAGDRVIHRRAPDAGLTGLGWLLAGHGILVAACLILEVTVERHGMGRPLEGLLQLLGPLGDGAGVLRRIAHGLGAVGVGLELLAASALIRMSPHRRPLATLYALVAGGAALAIAWPMLHTLGHRFDLRLAARLIPAAVQLVLPAATLVLVRRPIVPAAQARYRTPGPTTPPSMPPSVPPVVQ